MLQACIWRRFRITVLGLMCGVMSFGLGRAQGPGIESTLSIESLSDSVQLYKLRDPSKTLRYGQELLLRTSGRTQDPLRFKALIDCANAEKILANYTSALNYIGQAIQLAEKLGDPEIITSAYFGKAAIFTTEVRMDSAMVYYQKVIESNPELEPSFYLSGAFTGIGLAHWYIKNYDKAEEYLLKGVTYSRGLSDNARSFAISPLIEFYATRNDSRYLIYLDTLSRTEWFRKASPLSLMAHFDAFLHLNEMTDEEKRSRLQEIYDYYMEQNRQLHSQVFVSLTFARHLHKMGQYSTADSLLHSMLARTRQQGQREFEARLLNALADSKKAQGRHWEAVELMERLLEVNKMLLQDQNRSTIQELNARFEAEQKDLQIAGQAARLEQERRSRTFLLISLILGAAFSVVVVMYLRNRVRSVRRFAAQEKEIHEQRTERLLQEKEFASLTASLQAKEKERNRIARDLHDEVGSTLSSIHVYSSAASKALNGAPEVTRDILEKMNQNTRQALENMSDIVWAINTSREGGMSFSHKLKNYGYDLLTPRGIACQYEIDPAAEGLLQQIEVRKNMLLIAKEAMNNIAKHSAATEASISLKPSGDTLELRIHDNGKGFNVGNGRAGNGIGNIKRRIVEMSGEMDIQSAPTRGTELLCRVPIANISETTVTEPA